MLALESRSPLCLAYNKPYFNKCYQERVAYLDKISGRKIDVCSELIHLYMRAGLTDIEVKQHSMYTNARHPDQLKLFYKNLLLTVDIILDEWLEAKEPAIDNYYRSVAETNTINGCDCVYQCLWIAQEIKP